MEKRDLHPLLSLAEAAEYLRVSPSRLADLTRAREIAAMKAARA